MRVATWVSISTPLRMSHSNREFPPGYEPGSQCGFVLGDRSSMAAKGVTYAGGRIDAGYRGEILVCLVNVNQPSYSLRLVRDAQGALTGAELEKSEAAVAIRRGDKIAQMSPFQSMTDLAIMAVEALSESTRGAKGFGSSGR
jgi:dUTP pyrophosphatase